MSLRHNHPYNGKRYLINEKTKIIHDLKNEKKECKIDKIESKDTYMIAHKYIVRKYINKKDYNGCKHCLKELYFE
jgi:hypothetical protein